MSRQRHLVLESLEDRCLLSVLTVVGTTPDVTGGTLTAGANLVAIRFNQPVLGGATAANYQLQGLGPDGLLGTADDTLLPLMVGYNANIATLTFPPLREDVYRLTVRDTLTDLAGNKLDGDGDGTAGGNWNSDLVAIPSSDLLSSVRTFGFGTPGSKDTSGAVGDLNADGKLDVVTEVAPSKVAVLLGDGAGGLATANTFDCGGAAFSIAISDFNGDGKSDVVTANGNGTIGVLLGNGAGGLGPVSTFASGSSWPYGVAVADFNGDGKQDLAVANVNTVGILLGNGAGGFGAATNFGAGGSNTYAVAAADLNGDGKQDVVAANHDGLNFGVLLGNGDGTFGAAATFSAGSYFPHEPRLGRLQR